MATAGLREFIEESNRIEAIYRGPYDHEIEAADWFLQLKEPSPCDLHELQSHFAPNKPFRDRAGLDVRVGNYIAPAGGALISHDLDRIMLLARSHNPWIVHVIFEKLHPYMDGNGRTGRMLWAWCMKKRGMDPFALPFLHRFYYQTLENS